MPDDAEPLGNLLALGERKILINGSIVPVGEAKTSVLDRGLMYGDAVYTTMKVSGGGAVFLDRHLERLRRHMSRLGFGQPTFSFDMRASVLELVRANGLDRGLVRITISRGTKLSFPDISAQDPFVSGICAGLSGSDSSALKVVTVGETRDLFRDVKSVNRLAALFALRDAKLANADEAIFCQGDALIEATGHNILAIRGQAIRTPDLEARGMAGIVRQVLCESMNVDLADIHRDSDDLLYLTNCLAGVVPVGSLDGRELRQDSTTLERLRSALKEAEDRETAQA